MNIAEIEREIKRLQEEISRLRKTPLDINGIFIDRNGEDEAVIKLRDELGRTWYLFSIFKDGSFSRFDGIPKELNFKVTSTGKLAEHE